MQRRQVITGLVGLASATMVSQWHAVQQVASGERRSYPLPLDLPLSEPLEALDPPLDREQAVAGETAVALQRGDARYPQLDSASPPAVNKNIDFARDYADDIYVSAADAGVLLSVSARLQRLQQTIGYGHFNIVSFDQARAYAKRYSAIGEFSLQELAFIEKLFATDARQYGFYGEKVSSQLTQVISQPDTVKIPASGHYLFQNASLAHYQKLRKEVGESIILTSGIRGNIKQLHLFIAKAVSVQGNLSRASRSLAPPGYSYHGIGDFDVGRVGWGAKNFSDAFADTDEFKRMQDLGYVAIRYDRGNKLGVRFEPWHIKVV
ncbi:MAG: M15 family metallopeptidase [Cellvibrionaceae bacterium]|nr:M15 family metallopeptidase [Cellvibrionaceae bacterium]